MFQIGDKIFYPMHGAGIIEQIEEKEMLGKKQKYYIFNMPHRNMQCMIPIGNTKNLAIREVVDDKTLEEVFKTLQEGKPDTSIHRHQRYNIYLNKMKTGDIFDCAEVIRDLVYISKDKNLSSNDKTMLNTARQILVSEVVLVKNIDEETANELIDDIINS